MNPADREVLYFLNRLIGESAIGFELALLFCGQIPLIVCVTVLLALWWTDVEGRSTAPVLTAGTAPARFGLLESRRRCVALAASVTAAFVLTRLMAFATDLPRPLGREVLHVPIEQARWDDVVRGMTGFGAFPSDHAALFFALAAGLFAWNRAAGWVGVGVATVFSLARVAVGFHYPSDVLAGGPIGAAMVTAGRALAPRFRTQLDLVVDLFERFPAAMYPLLFVAAIDFTQHFRMLMGAVFAFLFKFLGFSGAV